MVFGFLPSLVALAELWPKSPPAPPLLHVSVVYWGILSWFVTPTEQSFGGRLGISVLASFALFIANLAVVFVGCLCTYKHVP